MEKVNYFGIQLNLPDTSEVLRECSQYIKSPNNHLIFFLNAHCYNIAVKNISYKNAINNADILLNDGIGIKLGLKFLNRKQKENMNGTDFIPNLLKYARDNKLNVYLLGAEEGISARAKQKLEEQINGISIVGARNGFFDFDDPNVVNDIVQQKTDLLVVGMGVPRQELWLTKHKDSLKNVRISVAGGAVLDFISENVIRAPKWMRKLGIEWVFRLLQEPLRLFKRYFIGIPVFFFNLVRGIK